MDRPCQLRQCPMSGTCGPGSGPPRFRSPSGTRPAGIHMVADYLFPRSVLRDRAAVPLEKFAPVAFFELHVEFLGGRLYAPPCLVALVVADTLHLIEPCDRGSNVIRIFDR